MIVTRRTFTGLYVTEEMTKSEFKQYNRNRAIQICLLSLISILTCLCFGIWFCVFLRLL